MSDDSAQNPEDEFREMLNQFLSGRGDLDPSQLAGAAGLPSDPAALQALLGQLQNAMRGAESGDGSVDWSQAEAQARQIAATGAVEPTAEERAEFAQAFQIAALWLDGATTVAELTASPTIIGRAEWARRTMPVWIELASPVSTSISDTLAGVLQDQAPEQLQPMIAGASKMLRSVGGALFAMQLGQVVGRLSTEVVSGGDIGIPLLADNEAVLLPQNVAAFGEGLDIPLDQVRIYLAVREIAHARLFRSARWLRLHLLSSITAFARGISIDASRMQDLAASFDPSNPEELQAAMSDGSLIPPKTDAQLVALAKLETTLALIEGWVDVVTADATKLLPKAVSLSETVKRRRATGGPAESAFSTLVGLELRPRRLREAAQMWRTVTDAVGADARDALWSHPDLVPTAEDIDNPDALVARLQATARGEVPARDEMDDAIDALLASAAMDAAAAAEPEAQANDDEKAPGPDADGDAEGDAPAR